MWEGLGPAFLLLKMEEKGQNLEYRWSVEGRKRENGFFPRASRKNAALLIP